MSSLAIKILAILAMLTDHIGVAFDHAIPLSAYIFCRVVGRVAMPLFCFLIAEGLFYTRDVRKYLLRLAAFALVSEMPFDRLFNGAWLEFSSQNVGFTLLLGLLGIMLYDTFAAQGRKSAALAAILASGAAATLILADYGFYGVYYIFIFYYFRKRNYAIAVMLAVGTLLLIASLITSGLGWKEAAVSMAAVASVIPISLYSGERGRDGPAARMAFYAFYPAHLMVLYAATLIISPL